MSEGNYFIDILDFTYLLQTNQTRLAKWCFVLGLMAAGQVENQKNTKIQVS